MYSFTKDNMSIVVSYNDNGKLLFKDENGEFKGFREWVGDYKNKSWVLGVDLFEFSTKLFEENSCLKEFLNNLPNEGVENEFGFFKKE